MTDHIDLTDGAGTIGAAPAIGPVQVLAIGFGSEAENRSQILNELERLEGKGLIRVLDLLFVGEDEEAGELVALNYQGDDLGALVGALLGFAFEGEETQPVIVEPATGETTIGVTRAHLEEIISRTPPSTAIGILLIEHEWARELKQAIRDAGGTPLAEGFLSADAVASIRRELEETVVILEELEREDAMEPGSR